MRKINFGEISVGETARSHIDNCISKNKITMGEKVKLFEKKWNELFGYKYSCAVNSGTSAIFNACLCLYSLGAKRGDEIIVPALGFIATSNAVLAAGFTPVFCDIKRNTLNLDETKVKELITRKTKAIIAVSTMGKPCKMDVLSKICKEHSLLFICDNAEGHGCRYKGKFMAEWADLSTYSCYAAHLIFSGEMGVVCTNNVELFNDVVSTRSHGRKNGSLFFDHERFGWNSKPTDLHSCIGLESIELFWDNFEKRKSNLNYMINKIESKTDKLMFNLQEKYDICSPHAFSITFKEDNENKFVNFYKYLEINGIQCKLNFKSNPTQQKAFDWMERKLGEFPEAEFVGRNGLHIGCHQFLTKEDLDYIVETILIFSEI